MNNTIKQAVVSVDRLEEWKIKARYFEDDTELDALIDDMNVVIDSAEDVEPHAYTWIDDGKGSTQDLPLYLHPATPTERLSDEEILTTYCEASTDQGTRFGIIPFARAIEQKIMEKNKDE